MITLALSLRKFPRAHAAKIISTKNSDTNYITVRVFTQIINRYSNDLRYTGYARRHSSLR